MSISAKVKICGITTPDMAAQAASMGADALGVVFYAKSPRYVEDLGLAREIAQAAGPFVTVVGLFVNPEVKFVEQVLANVPLGLLQFHGDEQDAFCQSFKRPYIKALRMDPEADIESIIAAYPSAQGILLDTYKPGVPGGTGETFDWDKVPKQSPLPLVLAGGLTADNVGDAVRQVRPWAVDVSGGVEASPGVKDPYKVKQFIDNAKHALAI